jgi:ketosteroid isomerase-like protein
MMDVAVLFANEAFYAAFTGRDLQAMDQVWSHRETITCIHPGWTPLFGREAVMESWRAILTNPQSPEITVSGANATVLGEVAYVLCYEHLSDAVLIATNVFVREDGWWRLVHHQAGTSPPPAESEAEEPMRVQ